MTLREIYEWGRKELQNGDIAEADLDAWYLLEYVTGINKTVYFLKMNETVETEYLSAYKECIGRRVKRIPLQHITGVQEFMGLEYGVNEHVLIPRQDTEILVESVLEILRPGMQVLDLCTGSGCIIISLAKLAKQISGVGVDISGKALEVAKENAKRLGADVQFLQGDLWEPVSETYDVIVSNPPYIRTAVIDGLQEEVKLHDPLIALDGKEDGLYFYKEIVKEAPSYLNKGGWLYFEIGHDQGADVKEMMEQTGFQNVTVKKDLAGLDRVVFGVYNV